MTESNRLVDLVQLNIDEFLEARVAELTDISDDVTSIGELATSFLSGGKRFRALFCYWGWQSVSSSRDPRGDLSPSESEDDLDAIVSVASALEIFHAAALVHDDIMDNSDTRRGAPSAHKRFEESHRLRSWVGDPSAFGTSAALLLGDLLLGWSDELFGRGTDAARHPSAARAARTEFSRMRTEVTAGQYLDILEESAWSSYPESDAISRAHRVIVYKSAKYSIEAPLVIGAALGGADSQQSHALREFGLPLGIAYQLRDDVLGVFGDAEITGKPAGDDLKEGKRTVLVALGREMLPSSARRVLDDLLGDPSLDDRQIAMLRSTLIDCGALDRVEQIIDRNAGTARKVLDDAPLSRSARAELMTLTDTVTRRTF